MFCWTLLCLIQCFSHFHSSWTIISLHWPKWMVFQTSSVYECVCPCYWTWISDLWDGFWWNTVDMLKVWSQWIVSKFYRNWSSYDADVKSFLFFFIFLYKICPFNGDVEIRFLYHYVKRDCMTPVFFFSFFPPNFIFIIFSLKKKKSIFLAFIQNFHSNFKTFLYLLKIIRHRNWSWGGWK